MGVVEFSLVYSGEETDAHVIDFYDVAEALTGFQRSLALTTHLVLTGEIITQAPALKGARIFALPPEESSWKFTAIVTLLGTSIYSLGTADKETPLGHLVSSVYDYAVSQTLGFHVDYDKTLGQQYEEAKKERSSLPPLSEPKIDALMEKIEGSVKSIHRPIVGSETAGIANLLSYRGGTEVPLLARFDRETYEYVNYTLRDDRPILVNGRISSYNINTFKGRIYSFEEARPIPFILTETARDIHFVNLITWSLNQNAQSKMSGQGDLCCTVLADYSRNGTVKRYIVLSVTKAGELIAPPAP
jgi:hypothetical protein